MSNLKRIQNNIERVKNSLHYEKGITKSRLAYTTGLHFFVVEDVLEYLKNENKVEEIKRQWRLKK